MEFYCNVQVPKYLWLVAYLEKSSRISREIPPAPRRPDVIIRSHVCHA